MVALRAKPGAGLDLRPFGDAKVVRTSDIVWDTPSQRWLVRFLHEMHGGMSLSVDIVRDAGLTAAQLPPHEILPPISVLLFAEYEDAIDAEVLVVQALRQRFGPDAV